MEITIKWFDGKYPSFNVCLASQPGKDPFIEIKGCRVASGKEGDFVGWPATKNEKSGKYWNHVYASNEFAKVVLKKAKESQPKQVEKQKSQCDIEDIENDIIPF